VKGGKAVAAFEFGAIPDEKEKLAAEKDIALFNKRLREVTGAELGRADCPQSAELKEVTAAELGRAEPDGDSNCKFHVKFSGVV